MAVTHCLCSDTSFAAIVHLRDQGLTMAQIRRETGACAGCRMCEPYVRLALATGQVVFPVLTAAQVRRVMGSPEVPPPGRAPDVC
ncbi:MAG: hypothetical protein KDA21_14245 [Phycisphaerales bacterium]|nr:hypothetical protein [Phycisphaerales bacterium]